MRQGDVSVLDLGREQFNVITMNHVIEHLHEPVATLRFCYQLLKPGGWLWIETPNLNSQDHARYRANWLHLDPPRHLVLFTRSSLQKALQEAGFRRIEDLPYRPQCAGSFAASEAIARGEDPHHPKGLLPFSPGTGIIYAEWKARREPSIREAITVKAWKE